MNDGFVNVVQLIKMKCKKNKKGPRFIYEILCIARLKKLDKPLTKIRNYYVRFKCFSKSGPMQNTRLTRPRPTSVMARMRTQRKSHYQYIGLGQESRRVLEVD